ncbi:MAG: CHAT domain-containing protein, partial [Acidobacteriota bacterium]
ARPLLLGLTPPAGVVHPARADLAARRLAGEPSMEQLIRDFRFTVDGREATRGVHRGMVFTAEPLVDEKALRGLDALLIDPIREHLPSDPDVPVVLVPQGRLFQVPFAALLAPDRTHLIERHPLLVVPSLAVLDLLARRGVDDRPWHPNEVLVVGDPKYSAGSTLIQLGAARSEAVDIASLWGADPLLDAEATLGEVVDRLGTARLVHLATHAWPTSADPDARFPGTLALTPDDSALPGAKEGLLSADLVRERQLGKFADLVVASACDTGGGHLTSDGVLGLARSFLASGTRRVVVRLWQVPDQPTEALMVDFHQALLAGSRVEDALRDAMLEAIRKKKPYAQWAAFVAFGAPTLPPAIGEAVSF